MLYKELEKTGQFFFRWRSFLPFLVLPLALYFGYQYGVDTAFQERLEPFFIGFALCVSCIGLGLRALTVGFVPKNTSGRTTERQKADTLNTTGMYSMIRHPLYFANFLIFSGFLILFRSIEFYVIASLLYLAYYVRIMMAEERFLVGKFGAGYEEWASKTPAFFPRIALWRRPILPFSWKKVLRQEMPTILLVSAVFFLFELVEDVVVEHESLRAWYAEDHIWAHQFLAVFVLYGVIKFLRKKTSLLSADMGR